MCIRDRCYILADTYFIAQAAGTDGVTLLNLCLPIYNFIFAIGSMIALGSADVYKRQSINWWNRTATYWWMVCMKAWCQRKYGRLHRSRSVSYTHLDVYKRQRAV